MSSSRNHPHFSIHFLKTFFRHAPALIIFILIANNFSLVTAEKETNQPDSNQDQFKLYGELTPLGAAVNQLHDQLLIMATHGWDFSGYLFSAMTSLRVAMCCGSASEVNAYGNGIKLLLRYGANPASYNRNQLSALGIALDEKLYPALDFLLEHKANTHLPVRKGSPSLPIDIALKTRDVKAIELFCKHKYKINIAPDPKKLTLVEHIMGIAYQALSTKNGDDLDFILELKQSPHTKNLFAHINQKDPEVISEVKNVFARVTEDKQRFLSYAKIGAAVAALITTIYSLYHYVCNKSVSKKISAEKSEDVLPKNKVKKTVILPHHHAAHSNPNVAHATQRILLPKMVIVQPLTSSVQAQHTERHSSASDTSSSSGIYRRYNLFGKDDSDIDLTVAAKNTQSATTYRRG